MEDANVPGTLTDIAHGKLILIRKNRETREDGETAPGLITFSERPKNDATELQN